MVFRHAKNCQWPYQFTKAEFESYHGTDFLNHQIKSQYISANKKVWEYGRDYYTISNDYQQYERHFRNNGVSSSKLIDISSINMNNLKQLSDTEWTS